MFAHHVQKKIIKKKMDRRPKKHRLSDINRKNVNHDKCITKVSDAPADYTLLKADGTKRNILQKKSLVITNPGIMFLCITIFFALYPVDRFFFLFYLDYNQIKNNALNFWENGDSAAPWLEFTEDDMVITFSQNRDPLPEGGVMKVPKLARSGTV